MTGAPGPRPDIRLETAPMTPVTCADCGMSVEARKASWEQTSIQWRGNQLGCQERQLEDASAEPRGPVFPGCERLYQSLSEAIQSGALQIVGEPR